jgi:hypothetical protein
MSVSGFVQKGLLRTLFILSVLVSATNTEAQTPTPLPAGPLPSVTFHMLYLSPAAPVKVARLMLGDKEIPFDTPIPVQGQWLRDVSVVLQNTSSKTIVSGGVILTYPQTGNGTPDKPTISTPLIRGRRPDHAYLKKDGSLMTRSQEGPPTSPLTFAPGNTMNLTVGSPLGELNEGTIYQVTDQISQVNIQVTEFYFSDDSEWNAGSYYLPEPAPVRYRKITPEEFAAPGKTSAAN